MRRTYWLHAAMDCTSFFSSLIEEDTTNMGFENITHLGEIRRVHHNTLKSEQEKTQVRRSMIHERNERRNMNNRGKEASRNKAKYAKYRDMETAYERANPLARRRERYAQDQIKADVAEEGSDLVLLPLIYI